jgi:hypothetical protein
MEGSLMGDGWRCPQTKSRPDRRAGDAAPDHVSLSWR